MKRKLLISLCVLLLLTGLSAADFSASGSGDSEKSAREDALYTLSARVRSEVSTVHYSTIYGSNDGVSADQSQQLSSGIVLVSEVPLSGVLFETLSSSGGKYTARAYIPESEKKSYLSAITTTTSEIKSTIAHIDALPSSDTLSRQNAIYELLRLYDDYDVYSYVLTKLDPGMSYPMAPGSRTVWKSRYQELLNTRSNSLSLESAALRANAAIGEKERAAKLKAIAREQNALREEADQLAREQELWRQSVLDTKDDDVRMKAQKLAQSALAGTGKLSQNDLMYGNSPIEKVAAIDQYLASYNATIGMLNAQIENVRKSYQDDYDAEIQALRDQPYHAAELSGGKPTAEAKSYRAELEGQIKKKYEDKIEKERVILRSSVDADLSKLKKQIEKAIAALEDETFALDSRNGDISVSVGQYDGAKSAWPVRLNYNILDEKIDRSFDLTYKEFEDVSAVPKIGSEGYKDYLATVDVYEAFFALPDSRPLEVVLEYTLKADTSGQSIVYTHTLVSGTVIRNDNGKTIISVKGKTSQSVVNQMGLIDARTAKLSSETHSGSSDYLSGMYVSFGVGFVGSSFSSVIMSAQVDNYLTFDQVPFLSFGIGAEGLISLDSGVHYCGGVSGLLAFSFPIMNNRSAIFFETRFAATSGRFSQSASSSIEQARNKSGENKYGFSLGLGGGIEIGGLFPDVSGNDMRFLIKGDWYCVGMMKGVFQVSMGLGIKFGGYAL